MRWITLVALLIGTIAWGDTPPARAINSQTYDGTGALPINAATIGGSNALDVNVLGSSATPSSAGRAFVTSVRNVYSSTNVTTGAWVTLVSSLGGAVNEICIFDSSGQTLELSTGAGHTVSVLVFPGGNGCVSVSYASGTKISIEAVSADATVGEIDINFMD